MLQQKFASIYILLLAITTLTSRSMRVASTMAVTEEIISLGEEPLRKWRHDRMVRCIFCMNYDDYNNLSTFGCELARVHTCWGNFCYMRQHKRPEYFLYTSGCLNFTSVEMAGLRMNVAAMASESGQRGGGHWGNETQLCEVGQTVNTCICTNRHLCNNVTAVEPYIEYSDAIFTGIDFDELAHFRFLLPDDPILHEFEQERMAGGSPSSGSGYLLVKDSAQIQALRPHLLATALLLAMALQKLLLLPFNNSITFLPRRK